MEQVLELVPEVVPHAEGQSVLSDDLAAPTSLVAEVHVEELAVLLVSHAGAQDDLLPIELEARFLLLRPLGDAQAIELRRDDVEGEQAPGSEVPPHTRERGELILDGIQVLEASEPGEDHREAVVPEVELLHGAGNEPERRRWLLGAQDLQHLRRGIEARAGEPLTGDWEEQAPRATPELQNRSRLLPREGEVEVRVPSGIALDRVVRVEIPRLNAPVLVGQIPILLRESRSFVSFRVIGGASPPARTARWLRACLGCF